MNKNREMHSEYYANCKKVYIYIYIYIYIMHYFISYLKKVI